MNTETLKQENKELRRLLTIIFDKYETGDPCYDVPDDPGGVYIGNAVWLDWNKLLADHKDNLIRIIYSTDEQHQCPKEFQHIDDPELHDCYCFICRYYSGVPQYTYQCPCYYYGKQESFNIAKQRLAIEGLYPALFEEQKTNNKSLK